MRKLLISTLIMLGLTVLCGGGERVLLDLNFDDQVAGQPPKGWSRAWGTQDDDQLIVTSTRWVSPGNSMMLDRLTGANTNMWGMSTSFDGGKSGSTRVEFNIMIEGPANLARCSLEFRGNYTNTERLFSLGFKDLTGSIGPRKGGIKFKYETGKWYHAVLEVPNSPADGNKLDFEWYPVGHADKAVKGSIPYKFPKKGFGTMMLNTAPGKRGFQVFIDDIKVTTTSEPDRKAKKMISKKQLAAATIAAVTVSAGAGVDQKLKDFMAASSKERVAIIGIGDSNQYFGGHGWNTYMSEAMLKQFGAYGIGLVPFLDTVPDWSKAKGSRSKDAPSELSAPAMSYWYLKPGEQQKANWNVTGRIVSKDHPMDIKGNLKYQITYGTFKEGESKFHPAVRRNRPPWNTLKYDKAGINPVTGKLELLESTFELPADPKRDYDILFSASPVNSMMKGPFMGVYMTIENTGKTTGCTYQTLYGAGGHSLLEMLRNLSKTGETKLAYYFKQVRAGLNGDKRCLVMINSGLNDRNRSVKSIGPEKQALSNTKEGYKDNLKGLVMLLENAWIKAGGAKENIYFAFMPSHPISTPDDKKLVIYRDAAKELAASLPNASCIMLPELVSQQTMHKDKYYDKRGNAHLSRKGYQKISEAVAKAIAK